MKIVTHQMHAVDDDLSSHHNCSHIHAHETQHYIYMQTFACVRIKHKKNECKCYVTTTL